MDCSVESKKHTEGGPAGHLRRNAVCRTNIGGSANKNHVFASLRVLSMQIPDQTAGGFSCGIDLPVLISCSVDDDIIL